MTYVQDTKTRLTADQAAAALAEGYRRVTGSLPSAGVLLLLVAQSALETAHWDSMHNFNFGNVRGHAPDGSYTSFRAGEVENGKEVMYEAGDPRNKFRAYPDALSGATDYVRVLRDHPNWWNGLQTGNVPGFIAGLTAFPGAYFTANPNLYADVLQRAMGKYATLAVQYGKKFSVWAAIGAGLAAVIGFKTVRHIRSR